MLIMLLPNYKEMLYSVEYALWNHNLSLSLKIRASLHKSENSNGELGHISAIHKALVLSPFDFVASSYIGRSLTVRSRAWAFSFNHSFVSSITFSIIHMHVSAIDQKVRIIRFDPYNNFQRPTQSNPTWTKIIFWFLSLSPTWTWKRPTQIWVLIQSGQLGWGWACRGMLL